jgi:hypothetical protein
MLCVLHSYENQQRPKRHAVGLLLNANVGVMSPPRPLLTLAPVHVYTLHIGPTPLPVSIIGAEKPDPFFTYTLPSVSIVVAALAALFAGLALRYIGKQINIANDQTALAREGIAWAKKDFDKTVEALEIAHKQASLADAERAKKPELRILFNDNFGDTNVRSNENNMHVIHIENIGDRAAEDAEVTLLIPGSWRPSSITGTDPILVSLGEQVDWENSKWFKARRIANRRIVRDVKVPVMEFLCSIPPGDHPVHWIIRSEGMMFPGDNSWATFVVHAI